MRTTEHALHLTLAGKPAASRLSGLTSVVMSVWRMWLDRRAIGNLRDLDDHQLMDIGLSRQDVDDALTSAYADNPVRHLVHMSRKRADAFYRDQRRD